MLMGLAVTWQREFQDVSSVSAERLDSHGYREAYLGKVGSWSIGGGIGGRGS